MNRSDLQKQLNRLNTAYEKCETLAKSFDEWPGPKLEARVNPDRMGWQLILRLEELPEIDKWEILFDEGVYHLRSALENLVNTTLTTLPESTKPQDPKRVCFPICKSEVDWETSKRAIEHLPEKYIKRIEKLQPFQRPKYQTDISNDGLLMLQELSNKGKHYLQVLHNIEPLHVTQKLAIEFETENDAKISLPPDIKVFKPTLLEHEQVVLQQNTKGKVAKVEGTYEATFELQAVINGQPYKATELLGRLHDYITTVFQVVAND